MPTIEICKGLVGHRVYIRFSSFMNLCLFILLQISKPLTFSNLHFFLKTLLFQSLFLIIIEITYKLITKSKTLLSKVILLSYELQPYYN